MLSRNNLYRRRVSKNVDQPDPLESLTSHAALMPLACVSGPFKSVDESNRISGMAMEADTSFQAGSHPALLQRFYDQVDAGRPAVVVIVEVDPVEKT